MERQSHIQLFCRGGGLLLEKPKERVVAGIEEEGLSEVRSCVAQAAAEVGEVKLVSWSCWMESGGMVSGLSHCLSKHIQFVCHAQVVMESGAVGL